MTPLGSADFNPRVNAGREVPEVKAIPHTFTVTVNATEDADGIDPLEVAQALEPWVSATEGVLDVEVHPAEQAPMIH